MLAGMAVSWIPPDDTTGLSAVREAVARRSPSSFFTSVHWLDACMRSWPATLDWRLARIGGPADDAVVAALLGRSTVRRHGVIRSRVLALNESVQRALDEAHVEMNGFFGAASTDFESALGTLVASIDGCDDWDELRLSGLLPDAAAAARRIAARHGLFVHLFSRKGTYWIDLEQIRREHDGDFLAAVSANTRQQLRRARRALERERGAVRLERAASSAQALDWLTAVAPLHRLRWSGLAGMPYGGFDNPHFVGFHTTLIESAFEADAIHLWRACSGDTPFAYLYNLHADRRASFYLCGIDYTIGDRFKPGLLAHALAVQAYLDAGASCYDFMAGDSRYKSSLATHESEQVWLVLQRPRVQLRIERFGRRLRNAWRARAGSAPPGQSPSIRASQRSHIVSNA
jgi:hypothetical protein